MSANSLLRKTKAQLLAEIEKLQQRLARMESAQAETYRLLLDESSDPIFAFYPDGTYRYVNRAFSEEVGKKVEEIIGHKMEDIFPPEEAEKRYAVIRWVFENNQTRVTEMRMTRPDGDRFYITTAKPIQDEQGKVTSVICISKEITERKRMEEELRRLSTFDLLTNLYNRNFFETEVVRLQESRLYPISIVIVDLNNLKSVNDRFGHAAGDELLRRAAQVLRNSFRTEDIIARIGGDEFVVLLPQTGEAELREIVARLRANVIKQQDLLFSLSIGSATGDKGCSLTELLQLADDRMYQDKASQSKRVNHP